MKTIIIKSLLIISWVVIVAFFALGGIAAIEPDLLLNNDTIMSFIYSYASILMLLSIITIFVEHKINTEKQTIRKTLVSMLVASGLIFVFLYIAHIIGAPLGLGLIIAIIIFTFGNTVYAK